jgi:hypothetical protein
MKKLTYILAATGILLFGIVSCTPEDEPTPDTGDSRDKLVGTWQCTENSPTFGTQNYYVDISKDTSSTDKIEIDNFFGLGLGKSIKGSLSGNLITISNATVMGYMFNGTGSVSSTWKSISWSYTVDDGNGPENVTATYTKL